MNRDVNGRFTKGNNCGGRKKLPSDFAEAVKSVSAEALEVLVSIMRDKKAPAASRVKASVTIIERAYGKAPLTVEMPQFTSDFVLEISAEEETEDE